MIAHTISQSLGSAQSPKIGLKASGIGAERLLGAPEQVRSQRGVPLEPMCGV